MPHETSPRYGVMICGHGSRSQSAVNEFAVVMRKLPEHFPDWPVAYGYLEFATPMIKTGLDQLRAQGVNHILAVPGMLFAAGHAKNDIPSVLNDYAKEHNITISYGRELGIDLKLLAAAADRINEAIAVADREHGKIGRHETCLVVIGRGSSDPDANSNVTKVARMLLESLGLGWVEVGFSGVTFPLVTPCLEHSVKLGFKRMIVFPYFLFSGILVDRIYGFADEVAVRTPQVNFIKASYLNDHDNVIASFVERVHEILTGDNAMNCALCKYRAVVPGFEDEVGLVQESHHHHVEGGGRTAPGCNVDECDLCTTFCTGACLLKHQHPHDHHHEHGHEHGHHHHPYPQADHPLGPKSVLNRNKR